MVPGGEKRARIILIMITMSGEIGTEDTPPNEMRASFGGSAWEWVPELGQYYFHQFSVKQPDLNWEMRRFAGRSMI